MREAGNGDNSEPGLCEKTSRFQINKALGSFLLFFALAVRGSIFFTATSIGKLTNLCGGAVIGGIGGAMGLKGPRPGPKQLR